MKWKASWELLKESGNGWLDDKVMRMSAALAYYTILSVAPLLVLALGIAGRIFDPHQVQAAIETQLGGLIGPQGADAIKTMIEHASNPGRSVTAIVIGSIVLLFGASGVFAELQDALNTIWEVQPKPGRPVLTIIRERFLSFAAVLGTCFLLLVSLIVSAVLTALTDAVGLGHGGVVGHALSFCISFGVITLLFAMIFKVLPDVKIAWGDVWVGAVGTAFLFTVGKLLIGLYLGKASVASAYGPAGSLVVFVVWVYYSAQILYFGAEFTKAYANRFGKQIRPTKNAVPLTAADRAQQGIPKSNAAAQPAPAGR